MGERNGRVGNDPMDFHGRVAPRKMFVLPLAAPCDVLHGIVKPTGPFASGDGAAPLEERPEADPVLDL